VSRSRRTDLLVGVVSLALALWVTSGLWIDPARKASEVNSGDQALFEWLLSYGAYAITHGVDPLYTNLLNVPNSVNLAVNTSVTAYAILFAPVTMTLGAPTSFLVILTLNLAGSAFAWYWLFRKHLGASPLGAAIGGVFAGFAPAMISHANAHLNWTAQWIIPMIIARVIVIYRGGKVVRNGVGLGLLVAVCFSLAAEALFFTALALGVFSLVWLLVKRPAKQIVRNVLIGLGLGASTAAIFLIYPLYLHFLGPQRYHGTGFDPKVHNEDLAAYAVWPERSLAGLAGLNTHLAPNPTEENSFFGVPLMVLLILSFGLLWKRAEVKALAATAVVFILLSLGPELRFMGHLTGIPMPEALVGGLPVFNAALPSRLALVISPIVGLMLAWLVSAPKRGPRWVWATAFVVALLPLVPLPILSRDREPVPHFISSGGWKSYVDDGGVIVPLPLPNDLLPDGQRWQAYALGASLGEGDSVFRVPSGFFLGPGGPNGTGRIGPVPRPTASLLEGVAKTGKVPPIGEQQRKEAREDLAYWDARIVVLADTISGAHWTPHYAEVLEAATQLFGAPQRVDDVWVWRVEAKTG
jgi:hypothetical protein